MYIEPKAIYEYLKAESMINKETVQLFPSLPNVDPEIKLSIGDKISEILRIISIFLTKNDKNYISSKCDYFIFFLYHSSQIKNNGVISKNAKIFTNCINLLIFICKNCNYLSSKQQGKPLLILILLDYLVSNIHKYDVYIEKKINKMSVSK